MEEPPLAPTDVLFTSAFWQLTTERQLGMSAGPIPWSSIVHYADRAGLHKDVADLFVAVIRAMDNAYLNWHNEQRKRGTGAKKK